MSKNSGQFDRFDDTIDLHTLIEECIHTAGSNPIKSFTPENVTQICPKAHALIK
jgi:hypothetical protein